MAHQHTHQLLIKTIDILLIQAEFTKQNIEIKMPDQKMKN